MECGLNGPPSGIVTVAPWHKPGTGPASIHIQQEQGNSVQAARQPLLNLNPAHATMEVKWQLCLKSHARAYHCLQVVGLVEKPRVSCLVIKESMIQEDANLSLSYDTLTRRSIRRLQ